MAGMLGYMSISKKSSILICMHACQNTHIAPSVSCITFFGMLYIIELGIGILQLSQQ